MNQSSVSVRYANELLDGQHLSVIIPAYNREKTIRAGIGSILDQTYLPDEIIIVDDCSMDRIADVVKEIADDCKFVKILYFRQKANLGAQAARNKGIELASGDWIAFLDSDDVWMPNKLERQVEELQKVGYDKNTVVHCNCMMHNMKTGEKNIWNLPRIDGMDVYSDLLKRPSPMFQAMLTSKQAIMEAGMLDEMVPAYQEWDTAIRLSRKCRFIHINEPLFEYLVHDTVFRSPKRDFEGYEYIVKKYEKEIINKCGVEAWRKHVEILVKKAVRFGDYAKGYSWAMKIPYSFFAYRAVLMLFILLRGKGEICFRVYDVYKNDGIAGIVRKIINKVWV